ncbi:hypothetical protein TNCV_3451011 [Trichonephila clavipes]|uniref:Uncharacterized protein n=1 Tax=Trichonephila clavipes TaxID=2585209 RepID=A0A8X6WJT7_TRICX|nr:hypothetical protein TNCV_3451011 [Trichonephila clavipes]
MRSKGGSTCCQKVSYNLLAAQYIRICDGSICVPSSNPLGKSLSYHLRLLTTNPFEEETVIFFQIKSTIYSQGFLVSNEEVEREKARCPVRLLLISKNRIVTCKGLKAKAYDRRKNLPLSRDEFRGSRSDFVRLVALVTTTTQREGNVPLDFEPWSNVKDRYLSC